MRIKDLLVKQHDATDCAAAYIDQNNVRIAFDFSYNRMQVTDYWTW